MKDHAKTHRLLEEADAFARSRLSKARYEHTLRVADTAENLALAHGLDADRARLAALLHDAAREMGSNQPANTRAWNTCAAWPGRISTERPSRRCGAPWPTTKREGRQRTLRAERC
jgi:hypothetical protein